MKLIRSHRRSVSILMLVLLAFWQVAPSVRAAVIVWDAGSTTNLNWSNGFNWGGLEPTSTDDAIFSQLIPNPGMLSTPETITLSTGEAANSLSFFNRYQLTGGDLTLASGGIRVSLGDSVTIHSQILGGSGLTLSGGGSLRLTNAANSYTGPVNLNGGSLIIDSAAALGGTGVVSIMTNNNSPLNTSTIGFQGGSLVLDGTAAGFTFARDVDFEGRGPIGERGSAILSLGNNILSGILRSAISPLPLSPTATIRNSRINSVNGTLTLSGTVNAGGTSATTFLNFGGVNSAGVGNFDLTGVLAGTGSIEKSGAGTLFLNPSSTSGFNGTLRISGAATGQQSSVRVTQASVGGTSIFGANTATTTSAAIDLNGGTLEFRNDSDLNFGALSSGKNVYTRSTGIIFTGPSAGGAAINGTTTLGALQHVISTTAATATTTFNSRNGFGVTFSTMVMDASTSTSTLTNTLTNNMGGNLTFTGNITLGEGNTASRPRALAVGGGGNTVIQGSVIAGTDPGKALTKSGAGNLTIQGVGTTVAGTVSITGGAITATDFRSLNNNSAAISLGNATTTGGNLIIGGTGVAPTLVGLTTSKTITLNTTTGSNSIYANQTGVNPVILNGAITKIAAATTGALILGGTNAADNIINVVIPVETTPSTGGVTKLGPGTWVLNAANTYLGASTIQNGTLKLRATAAASDVIKEAATNTIVFSGNATTGTAGGTLEFTGFSGAPTTETLGALTPTGGGATIRLIGNGGSAANLVFTSLGATTAASSVNFDTTGANGGVITLTGQAATTATTLPGTANFRGHLYVDGADFATINGSAQVVAPTYAGTGNFQNAAGSLATSVHNKLTGSFTNGAATVSSLVTNSQTLTLSGDLVVSTGGILQSGGTATIQSNGGTARLINQTGTAATNIAIRVDQSGDVLNLGTATNPVNIGSFTTGGMTKNGAGTLIIFGTNAQTGTTNINEGTVRLSGSSSQLSATSASLVIRQGATLELNGITAANATFAALDGAGTITNIDAATATITQSAAGTWNGVFQDGAGVLNVTKGGTTGAPTWSGLNTYTGVTTIGGTTGLITVDYLADGGENSGIGASSSAASNLVFSGTSSGLVYRGSTLNGALTLGSRSASTDRLFTLAAVATGATLSSTVTNNNAIIWSNSGSIINDTTAAATLIFTGTSTGDNTFNPKLVDSSTSAALGITKTAAGQWNLGNSNNIYTGATTVNNGILALNNNGALPVNSPLVLTPTSATSAAILQMSGTFERNLTATPTSGTGDVNFGFSIASTTGGVGFAAHTTPLTVAIGGVAAPTALTWGSGGFVGTGGVQNLVLNSATALSSVDFRNAIDLGASVRTINVPDNSTTGADYATMSGVLSSGVGGGLLKIGSGSLRLTGANTYTGTTEIQAGTLVVTSLGSSTGGGTSSIGTDGVTMNDTNAVVLGNATTTGGLLQYVGAGETSDRKIRLRGTTASNQIHADGSGPLILTNVANDAITETGNKTLFLRGSNSAGNMITSALANNGAGVLSVTVDGGATWILTGANQGGYTGNTTASGGALGIGADDAIGATLINSNGNIFAYGGDRTISNTLQLNSGASYGFLGDYSLTFTNPVTFAASTSSSNFTNNSIISGEALTFAGGVVANSLTASRNWQFDGPGETVINGDFTTSTGFGVNIIQTGNGTLTLGTNGTASNWNQANNSIDVDRGTLKFGTNNAIPTKYAAASKATSAAVPVSTTTYTVGSTVGLLVGQTFSGTNVPAGSVIVSIDSGTTFTTSIAPTTQVASGVSLTFNASGGLILSPELATSDTAAVDLNGTTQTVNSLTATTDGITIIDNSAATAASLTFGANDSAVSFGNGIGTYTITDTGGGALSIVKAGAAAGTIGAGATLTYQGGTSVTGGSLTIAAPVNGTTGLSVANTGSILTLAGGITTPGVLTAVSVGDGATLNLLDGSGSKLNALSSLSLGTVGGAYTILGLNVGDSLVPGDGLNTDTLTLVTGGTLSLFAGNKITFNLTDTGLNANTNYILLDATAVSGGFTSGALTLADYILGGTPGGFDSISLASSTNNQIILTTGNLILGSAYFTGLTDGTWNGSANNWSTVKLGTTPAATVPGQGTDVVFVADNVPTGNLVTTLEQNFKINSLRFEASATTPASVAINPGLVTTNRLEIAPQLAAAGISIPAGGPQGVTIAAPLRLGADQTWTAADLGTVALTGGATITGSPNVNVANTTGLVVGMQISGPGIPTGATITAITDLNSFTMSANATGANAALQSYTATSSLNVSGGLSGTGNLSKTGNGRAVLSGAGTAYAGTAVTVSGGILETQNATALGGVAATPNTGATITISSGGQFRHNLAVASTIANPLVLNGGTLSSGGFTSNATSLALTAINHTYSGTVNVAASSTIHLADLSNHATLAHTITMPGGLTGAGALIVDSVPVVSGGNQLNGLLQINADNSGWSGGLTMQRGTVATNNPNGIGSGPIQANAFGRINLQGTNGAMWTLANSITYAPGAITEIGVDNVSGTVTTPFVASFTGPVTLNTGSGMRLFISDGVNSAANFSGAFTLAGDGSISVGGAAGAVATISSVIDGPGALAVNDDLGGWGTTDRTLRLTGLNTFTGNVTLSEGVLEFDTVSDVSGVSSSLGQGTAITLGTATLSFIGPDSQSTDRPIATTGSPTLNAGGTAGATITFQGAITQALNNALTLSGAPASPGLITGGITQSAGGTTADLTVSSGSWTISGANSSIADDLLVTGGTLTLQDTIFSLNDDIVVSNAGTVLNLNSIGVWAPNSPAGTSSFLFSRGGAVVNINANNVNGVDNANGLEGVLAGDGTTAGTGIINMNGFSISLPRVDLGAIATGFDGNIAGPGTIVGTGTATDYSVGFRLFRGVISANLAGGTTILKQGLGDVTLSGDNSGLTGTVAASTRLDAGNLILDFTSNNTLKIPGNRGLDMRGGTVTIDGHASAASSQTVASLTFANGGSNMIVVNSGSGQEAVLALNAITRAVNAQDGTIRFVLPSGIQSASNGITTDTLNTVGTGINGIIGGWATVNDGTGVFYAKNATGAADSNIVAATTTLQDAVGSWGAGENISDSAGFTGTLASANINSLRFNMAAGSDLSIAPGGILGIASGGVLVTDGVGGSPSMIGGTLVSGAIASNVPELVITQDSTQSFEIGADIRINQAVTKTGAGTLMLSGNNVYTGVTEIHNGVLQVSGGNGIGDTSLVTLADDHTVILELLADETIGRLAGGSNVSGLSTLATVDVGSRTLTINETAASTYSGSFAGGGTVIKTGSAALTYNGISTGFTGTLRVEQGLVLFNGNVNQLAAGSNIVLSGSTSSLRLDNDQTAAVGSRIADTAVVTLNNTAGTTAASLGLYMRRTAGTTTGTETLGQLVLNAGHNVVAADGTAASRIGTINFTNAIPLIRNNFSTLLVLGRGLGDTVATQRGNVNFATDPGGSVGGAGAALSTTINIYPYVIGESTAGAPDGSVNFGNSFVRYAGTGAPNGFKPLTAAEYVTNATGYNALAGAATTDNVRFDVDPGAALTGVPASINSLVLDGAATITLTGPAGELKVNSGTILSAQAVSNTIDTFTGISTNSLPYYVYVTNPAGSLALNSPLSSAQTLVKSGAGTLVLGDATNAFTDLYFNQGIVQVDALNKLGTATLKFFGGTLKFAGVFDPSSKAITLGMGGGTFDTNGNDISLLNSVGSGVGGLTKTGLGDLTLNAAAAYTGATTLTSGSITIEATNALGVGGDLTLGADTTLNLGANSITHGLVTTSGANPVITGAGAITASAGFFFNHTGDTQIDAILAGSGGLLKAQTNVVTLTGASTYSGTTEIQAGTISFNTIANVGGGASALGAPLTVENGIIRTGLTTVATTLSYTGAGSTTDRIIEMQGTTGGLTINADGTGSLGLGTVQTATTGNKTLTLSGISDPALVNSIGTITEVGSALSLTKTGTNTWSLTAASSYTGTTTVSSGILNISHSSALGATATGTTVATGGNLDLSNNITVTGEALTLTAAASDAVLGSSAGVNTWAGNITADTGTSTGRVRILSSAGSTLNVTGAVNLSAGTADFVIGGDGNGEISGQITGSQRLFKSSAGAGTWILSADNSATFTGRATIGNGAIQIASESALGATPGAFTANQLTLGGGSTPGTLKTTATLAISANRGVTLGTVGGGFEPAAATTLTVDSEITGGGPLVKNGLGSLALTSNNNTYTGATNVLAGTLLVSNTLGSATGSGSVNVTGGATLGGTGLIAPAVDTSIALGGVFAPGTPGGTMGEDIALTVSGTGNISFDAQSIFEIFGNTGGVNLASSNDKAIIGATDWTNVIFGGSSILTIVDTTGTSTTWVAGDKWTIFDWSAVGGTAPTTGFATVGSTPVLDSGLTWDFSALYTTGVISVAVVVPEPSRALLLLVGMLGLLLRRRRVRG